jgi:hypothetical protein
MNLANGSQNVNKLFLKKDTLRDEETPFTVGTIGFDTKPRDGPKGS